jgi:apolipoprotein N-acyltransferase
VVRLSLHRRAGSGANRQRLLADDLGQVAAAAGSVVLLAYGFWPGAILTLAALLWLGLSARRSTQRKRVPLAAPH